MHKFGADTFFRGCETLRLDLLDLFGIDYVIEHFLCDYKERQENELRWLYTNETLYAMSNQCKMTKSYMEIKPKYNEPEKKRDADEVAAELILKMGLKFKQQK